MYPSIISGNEMINYAFHPDFVNSPNMILTKVVEYKVSEIHADKIEGEHRKNGINVDGQIKWLKFKSAIEYIVLEDDTIIVVSNQKVFKGSEALNLKHALGEETLKDVLPQYIQRGFAQFSDQMYKNLEVKDVFDFSPQTQDSLIAMDLLENSLEVVIDGQQQSVSRVVVRVKWKAEFVL